MNPQALSSLKILLASGSPRRKQLLSELGLQFETFVPDVIEDYSQELKGASIPEYLSQLKAAAISDALLADKIAIAADTIVWIDNQALNKPATREEAMGMLKLLSGRTHHVYTGVTIRSQEINRTFSDKTSVSFRALSKEEITFYVDHYAPYDKAGAYGAQDWIGLTGIDKIEGCYFNVMGLPVRKVYSELMAIVPA